MDVACSTLCFTRLRLPEVLRLIGELEFTKVDVAVGDGSTHVTTETLLENLPVVVNELKQGPPLGVAAITLRTARVGEQLLEVVDAAAYLAKQVAAPVLVLEAAPRGTAIDAEVVRLTALVQATAKHGATPTVTTRTGALTENPAVAVELCERVPGLGLTLDPSHFVCGPHQGRSYEEVFEFVQHCHLRDTGRRMDQLQVKIGRGEIEYGKIITSLCRFGYHGSLTVAMEDQTAVDLDVLVETRKLRLLLESYLVARDEALFRAA